MALRLYDLALADIDVRPSPFCWLAKFALLHKGLEFETEPLRFAEKHNYPDQDHGRVPVLRDGDHIIADSANIIVHLEKNYPGERIVATAGEQAAADFYNAWVAANLFPALGPVMYVRVHAAAHEDDREYYRVSREDRFGQSLEELSITPGLKDKAEASLKVLSASFVRHKFLGGDKPNLCDYIVFSPFMWQRVITSETLYETPQAVGAWQERMLDLFDSYARKAKTVR